jgi:hypothetical protein
MLRLRKPVLILTAALLVAPLSGARPAYADGAASTRNIIFGAAAAAGALIIINHNKKVHERYAEDARRQAALESERNNVQAAYESERQAYANEAALVGQYQREVAIQHEEVVRQRGEISSLKHKLAYAKPPSRTAYASKSQSTTIAKNQPEVVSYGWGSL